VQIADPPYVGPPYLPPRRCGDNAIYKDLKNGNYICECAKNFFGNPNLGCRPECVQNSDCSRTQACSNYRCVDPCIGLCGLNARCRVENHFPICTCKYSWRNGYLINTLTKINEIMHTLCRYRGLSRFSNAVVY